LPAAAVRARGGGRHRRFDGTTHADFRRWLFRIASNAINAHVRQARRRQELWQAAARDGSARAQRAGDALPMFERLDWPAVYQAILELAPREQTILTLRFFADLPHDEIAAVVGANPAAVRTALSRILDRLRARFGVEKEAAPGQKVNHERQPRT
jgi:RNA polymerase sigma factor (sigma-70 family)